MVYFKYHRQGIDLFLSGDLVCFGWVLWHLNYLMQNAFFFTYISYIYMICKLIL